MVKWNTIIGRTTVAVVLGVLMGCGSVDEIDLKEVSGTITFGGEPVATGTIEFVPIGPEGNLGGSPIRDGNYTIPKIAGLSPGEYQVKIVSKRLRADMDEPPKPGEALKPLPAVVNIPAKYNVDTELIETISGEDSQAIDFDLR